mmetsp:Transcript_4676/g.15617  ORF Transcript_4676/g.15617 Transcript_4676/m.15617 type:complete len:331 (+) Transcript_4676:610-1602(+)
MILQSRINVVRSAHFAHLGLHSLALFANLIDKIHVRDVTVELTLHNRPAVVLFNVPKPLFALHHDLLGKPLLLKVPHRVIIGKRDEMRHIFLLLGVLFNVIHQSRTVSFHLFVCAHGAKRDFRHALLWKRPIRNPTNHAPILHTQHRVMSDIKHQSHDVLLGHVWELFTKDILQRHQKFRVSRVAVILNHLPLKLTIALLLAQMTLTRGIRPNRWTRRVRRAITARRRARRRRILPIARASPFVVVILLTAFTTLTTLAPRRRRRRRSPIAFVPITRARAHLARLPPRALDVRVNVEPKRIVCIIIIIPPSRLRHRDRHRVRTVACAAPT